MANKSKATDKETEAAPDTNSQPKPAATIEEAIEADEKARAEAAEKVGKSEDEWRAEREEAEEEARAEAAETADADAPAST